MKKTNRLAGHEEGGEGNAISRRETLALAGTWGLGAIIPRALSRTQAGKVHAVTPEGEIGPFFADDAAKGFHRSDVRSNIDGTNVQPGIPFLLRIFVYDTKNGCVPMAGCQVDIWQCNADGVYSDEEMESTTGQTYLRGYQITDAAGSAAFKTIVPGWYQGRTTHIHVRVRSKYSYTSSPNDGSNTTQLFFSPAIIDHISSNVEPYRSRGANPTTNATDHVYAGETHAEMLMAVTGDYNRGFASTVAIYLPITAKGE